MGVVLLNSYMGTNEDTQGIVDKGRHFTAYAREGISEETRDIYSHMIHLQEKIAHTCRIARGEWEKNQKKNEKYSNRKARFRKLDIGDKVKEQLPLKRNKMLLKC